MLPKQNKKDFKLEQVQKHVFLSKILPEGRLPT